MLVTWKGHLAMQITHDEAVSMFREIGYKTAKKWDEERLTRKLNRLPSLLKDTPDIPESIKSNKEHICNRICREIEEHGGKIELAVEGDMSMAVKKAKKENSNRGRIMTIAEYEGREETPKKKKVKKDVKTEKKPLKKKKAEVVAKKGKEKKAVKESGKKEKKKKVIHKGLNQFGYRTESKAGKVDACLTKTPISAKDIARKLRNTKVGDKKPIDEAFIIRHLNHAVDNSRGVKFVDGKGYCSAI